MWICMNDSFLSVVAHRDEPDALLVRGRMPGDIEAVFPDAEVWEDPVADYRFRAVIARWQVASAIAGRLEDIQYDNFKRSVTDQLRYRAYEKIWKAMAVLQRG